MAISGRGWRRIGYLLIALALAPAIAYAIFLISWQIQDSNKEQQMLERARENARNFSDLIDRKTKRRYLEYAAGSNNVQLKSVQIRSNDVLLLGLVHHHRPSIGGNVGYDFCFKFRVYGDQRGDVKYEQVDLEQCGLTE